MIAALLTAAMAVGSVSGVTVFAADAGTDAVSYTHLTLPTN